MAGAVAAHQAAQAIVSEPQGYPEAEEVDYHSGTVQSSPNTGFKLFPALFWLTFLQIKCTPGSGGSSGELKPEPPPSALCKPWGDSSSVFKTSIAI